LIEQCVITKEGKSIGWASSEWLCRIFDVNSGAEAAQSVTIKDIAFPSHWANTFTAKTLIAERITADTVWECIGCKKLRVVQCTNTPVNDFSIHAPSEESTRCGLRFIDCTGGSIEIENSKLRYLTGRRRDLTGPLQRVKSLRIKDSYIMHCSSYPIIVESLTWDNSGMPRDGSGDMAISGYELKMPACSVTLRNLFFFSSIYSGSNYGYGSIDTMCRTWLCKAVMESVPVHTDIDGVIAGRIECGYQEDSAHLALNTSYTLQGQPLTLPPYHSQYLPNEPIEFKSPGTQTVQNFLTGYLCVLSGDRIDVTGGYSKYNTQHSVEASGGITAYLGHWWEDTDFDYNNKKAHPVCYIRNEKVENSTVTLRKMKMYRSWIRAVTNNLTVEGIYPFEGIGAMVAEFFGYDTVTVKNCLFKPCRGLSYSQNGSVKFSPGFIAVGKNRQIDSSVRFDSAHTVLTGTVVDTLRNGNQHSDTYPCTVAVKQ